MSMMNCGGAIQFVLDKAAARMKNLAVIHVEPDADIVPVSLSRRLSLPITEDAGLAFAMGCAQAGLRPVLDLTAVRDAVPRLEKAFAALPRAARAPLVIRVRDCACPALPGVRVIAPANARECAGAMRFALQSELICLILENPLAAYETCEVPDDPEELFAGGDPIPSPEPEPEETPAEAPENAPEPVEEAQPEPAAAPREAVFSWRIRPYDPAGLMRVASLVGLSRSDLAALCCGKVEESAEVVLETDAEPGETACLPPENADACLWVGYDRLALCWKNGSLSLQAARLLLADTGVLLETPERLILDKKK